MRRRPLTVVVGAIAIGIALSGCFPLLPLDFVGSTERPKVESTDPDHSQLTDEGYEEIASTRKISFDLSDGQLLHSDVGLLSSEHVPDVSPGPVMDLKLIGSKGTLQARTDHVRFLAFDGDAEISTIYYFLTADTPEAFFDLVRDGMNAYGFDQESTERWITDVNRDLSDPSDFALDPGYNLGFYVSYELSYTGPGHVNVIVVTVVPGKDGPEDDFVDGGSR